ncbi:site-specific integrase [Tenacibaculum sp. M341]|uniref:site-specific integrase n=1 Tax=Tenacibaculum sp. M341 TaxID=2530339 RepID=UPI00104289F5|nr:site-specific integrase [Tenacibaculum sp. M341]TCI93609.1 site-specific integrase [Tenacibaculum sp. M341]
MASVKIILWKHDKKKDGSCPLALRITKNRKPRYIFTGEYIFEKDWNAKSSTVKKSHPNSTRLNNLLLKKLSEAHATLLDAETSEENLTTQQIQTKVKRKGSNVSFFQLASDRINDKYTKGTFSVAKAELSILHNIQEYLNHNPVEPKLLVMDEIRERRKKRISKARKYQNTTSDEIKAFSKNKSLMFQDINTNFINKYKIFCASYLEQKPRTITNQLIFIRTLYNLAIKEGITDNKNYPFAGENEKIRIKSSNKIGLTKKEVEKIEKLTLEPHTSIWHTKNVFLFSYYFAGVRISDVLELKWFNFVDGRLYYEMNKNEKPVSLKIPDKALAILSLYAKDKEKNTDYVFPFLKKADQKSKEDIFVKTRNASKLFNKYLKRIAEKCSIEKNLSNHIARHTFGNIAGDKINPLMLQKLYRHSNLKTTINYQANFIHKEADDALDMVLNS